MTSLVQWTSDAVAPPGGDRYLMPAAVVAAVLIAVGLTTILRRRGRTVPLPNGEAAFAESCGGRWTTRLLRTVTYGLPIAAVTAALTPGCPSTITLTRQNATEAAVRRPSEFSRHEPINARPAIRFALRRLDALGAASWSEADRNRTNAIREAVLEAIRAPDLEPMSDSDPLPLWVTESVEISVVRGLALRHRAAWIGIDSAAQRPNEGWDAERAAYAAAGTTLDLNSEQDGNALAVRQLWNGRLLGGRMRVTALVSGSNTSGGTVVLCAGETRWVIPVPADGKAWRIVEVDRALSHPADEVVALPEGTTARLAGKTSLGSAGGSTLTIPLSWGVNRELADAFRTVWNDLCATSGSLVEELSNRRGLKIPTLVLAELPAENGPNLLMMENGTRVLPPGCGPTDGTWSTVAGPTAATRVLTDGNRGTDTFTALDLSVGPTTVGVNIERDGVLTDSDPVAGRFAVGVRQTRPLLSTLPIRNRIATAIHLPPRMQLRSGGEDPSRLRATVCAIVAAVSRAEGNAASPANMTACDDGRTPRGRCVLRESDLGECRDKSQRPSVAVATGSAACWFALLLVRRVRRRPAVPPTIQRS